MSRIALALVLVATVAAGFGFTELEAHNRNHAICVSSNRDRDELRAGIHQLVPPTTSASQRHALGILDHALRERRCP